MWPWIPKEDKSQYYLKSCISNISQPQINEAAAIAFDLNCTIAAIEYNLNSEYCRTVGKGKGETKLQKDVEQHSLFLQESLALVSDVYGGTKESNLYPPAKAVSQSENPEAWVSFRPDFCLKALRQFFSRRHLLAQAKARWKHANKAYTELEKIILAHQKETAKATSIAEATSIGAGTEPGATESREYVKASKESSGDGDLQEWRSED